MKFSHGLMITLLCVIAIAAEFFIYLFFGMAIVFSGDASARTTGIQGWAMFASWIFLMTIIVAIAAPVAGLIGDVTKKEHIGTYLFLGALVLSALGTGGCVAYVHTSSVNQQAQAAATPTPTPAQKRKAKPAATPPVIGPL
jgi:hypothetical protein